MKTGGPDIEIKNAAIISVMQALTDPTTDLATRLAGAHDGEIDEIVVDTLAALALPIGADSAFVTLFLDADPFGDEIAWHSAHSSPPPAGGFRATASPHAMAVAAHGNPVAVPDVARVSDAPMSVPPPHEARIASLLYVPMIANEETFGVLGFHGLEPVRPWSDELVERVERVAQVVGVTLRRRRANHSRRRNEAGTETVHTSEGKEAFLTRISHELRTPLHAILGFSELLDPDEPADRDAIRQIQANGQYLLTMVEDLIALTRSGSDPGPDVPLGPLLTTSLETLRRAAATQQVTIEITEEVHGVVVHDNLERLRQVLYCTISSCIRAIGRSGTIIIDAEQAAGDALIRLRLSGTKGIPRQRVALPIATALIDGHGTIDVHDCDGSVAVTVRFGQIASP